MRRGTARRKPRAALWAGVALALLHGKPSLARESAPPVPWGYAYEARAHGIPATVLYAIALTESGRRWADGRVYPWPWTLNVAGRGERYATRQEAHAALLSHLQRGVRSIDVGLMQINWAAHGAKLGTPWNALEPYHNLRIGAKILLEQYQRSGDWTHAIGRYHAPNNPDRAAGYRRKVLIHLAGLYGTDLP